MSPILSIPCDPLLYSRSFDAKKKISSSVPGFPSTDEMCLLFYIPKNSNKFGSSCEPELSVIDLAADRIYSNVI